MPIDLTTKQGEALLASTETPWQVYPRPQMRRDSFYNLNGFWQFTAGLTETDGIRVPFCPESKLSSVKRHFPEGTPLCYRRYFTLPEGFKKDRVLLHIGMMNCILFILNLLPVPGLDGWTVLGSFFPKIHRTDSEWINGASLVLLILIFTGFRYIAMAGSVITMWLVSGLVMLMGGA